MSTVEIPQHLAALASANRIRLARANIKRQVREGTMPLSVALVAPEVASMRVMDLLCVQRRWGPVRALKRLNDLAAKGVLIVPSRTCGQLSERQRSALTGPRSI